MPKIIENLPQRLVEEARRQIAESGYGAMTVRSVAKGCGVGVGTVYNYYPSKDALVAAFMLSDWNACMEPVRSCSETSAQPEAVLQSVYGALQKFLHLHEAILRDEAAAVSFSGSGSRYHSLLRSQLAQPVRKFCRDDFTAEFLAEALLTWAVEGTPFDCLKELLLRLF